MGIFKLLAAAAEKSLRKAEAVAQAAQAERDAAQQRAILQYSARLRGETPSPPVERPQALTAAPRPPAPRPPPAQRPAAAPRPEPAALPSLEDAFPVHVDSVATSRSARPASALLAAFGGGPELLGALILSEALAPPVALRPHRPPH